MNLRAMFEYYLKRIMKKQIAFIAFVILVGCTERETETKHESINIQEDYVLYKTKNEQSILLIVFPDLGGNAESTKENFNILNTAKEADISVLMMNFNHHLFLSKEDKNLLTETLNDVAKPHNLSPDKVVIGGFSSGGIVSSLWSNHLVEINHVLKPQKTFAVDSPLDLVELFNNVTDVDSTSHEVSIEEAEYIINYF
jgi:alpha/beta superfamily hydrolase